MKKALFVFLSLFTINAMAISPADCLDAQSKRFDDAKLGKEFKHVRIHLIDSLMSENYFPFVKVEGNKITISVIHHADSGLCLTAASSYIEEEVYRSNE